MAKASLKPSASAKAAGKGKPQEKRGVVKGLFGWCSPKEHPDVGDSDASNLIPDKDNTDNNASPGAEQDGKTERVSDSFTSQLRPEPSLKDNALETWDTAEYARLMETYNTVIHLLPVEMLPKFPGIVVVGVQNAGKSSVLEALTREYAILDCSD